MEIVIWINIYNIFLVIKCSFDEKLSLNCLNVLGKF